MADEPGPLTEAEAGRAIASMLESEGTPETSAATDAEKQEVKFLARKKAKKLPKGEVATERDGDKPIPLTPSDGSDDPDDDLPENRRPAKKTEQVDEEEDAEPDKETEQSDDEDEEEKPEVRMLRVKVDGQEIDVPEEEVLKGYSRTADYTRKTQALAAEREKFEKEERAIVRAERQQLAERLAVLQAIAQLPGEEPNWDRLRVELSPEEFTEKFTEWRGMQGRLQKIREMQEEVRGREVADAEKDWQAAIARETEKLKVALPDFGDAEKGKQLRADLVAYAKSSTFNFTDDDLAGVTDHRLLVLLDKARRWDEAQRRKPRIEDKIDRALDAIKPSATKSKPKTGDTERLQQRLTQTGSVDDAAALISKMKLL